jgi:Uroporphyrinogen-III synthase
MLGLAAWAFPLFEIRPLSWQSVPRESVDALLLGSANALRHGGEALSLYRGMPAYAVGASTAEAAREIGLDVVRVGKGGLQQVLGELLPAHRRLLRLAGRERVELTPPRDTVMITREVYASEALPIPREMADQLADGAIVLLHSGEAAAHLALQCDRAGIARDQVTLATIGPRVSERAGRGWASVRSASSPDDPALLALAAQICKEAASGSQLPEQGQAAD